MDRASELCQLGSTYGTLQQNLCQMLSSDQKKYHFAVCTELKEQAENNPNFISTIITGDESWVSGYLGTTQAVVSVEDSNLTVTEESTTSSEQCQIGVGLFF
jgi:hypothetical protein